ncbi:MAG TPA: pseudouridine synthase [Dongiaceae bacterium]|nr:pseudouridine synthase [Dongiaceae bacterium]
MADKRDNKATGEAAATEGSTGDRIAKVMARAGLCSRRDAEAWIAAGRVSLNGRKLATPAVNVGPNDMVLVDGKPLPEAEKTRLFRYHKPRGLVTTAKDPEGRPTVFDNLPEGLPRVISVGRLDLNSEGLLLLTNDGELARRLELPATGWVRRYRVRVNGRIDPASLTRLAKGIEIEGIRYGAIEAVLDRQQGDNAWLTMSLTEGKNREIRKVCAFFGWTVSRLIRLSYGPFQLGYLDKGEFEEVPAKVLRDQLGNPGAAQSLRPHQASGGKARPPKQKPEDRRTKRPDAERQESGASPRAGADDRRQTSGRRNAVYKPQHQAERREDFNRGRRPDAQHPEDKRHGGKRQDERRAAYRGPTQSAETLGASLRQALDRASRDELAEDQQNRTARPNRATGGKPSPTAGAEKNKRAFSGKNVPQDKPGAKKPGVKKPDAQKARAAGRSHADRQPAPAGAKSDSGRQKHPGDQRSGRADSKPANRNGKHAHRQRRP